jgi:hypothetical protein
MGMHIFNNADIFLFFKSDKSAAQFMAFHYHTPF